MGSRTRPAMHRSAALLLSGLLAGFSPARADEPVVTILADYEDDSVAAHITDVENVLTADCDVGVAAIPARGQRSLMIDIGATTPGASAACDLRFRLATPFEQANRVATHAWINEGSVEIHFRVRDAAGRLFETAPLPLQTRNRWVRLIADLGPRELRPATQGASTEEPGRLKPAWPIQIQGYHIRTRGIGRQTIYFDDLQVEHRVSGAAILRGEFRLDEPTHLYEPGAPVRAAVVLENTSRSRALALTVQLAWLRSDGSDLTTGRQSINLPASGDDYRSRQAVDFSQRITNPGLYRLVARVRGSHWISPAVYETTIAITRTNRTLPRGRATFFGVCTNLMREPLADQFLEIDLAREVGVQLLALQTPWRVIEPARNAFNFETLDRLIGRISRHDMATMIVLTEPPEWLAAGGANSWDRQATLFEALAQRYGDRIGTYQPLWADAGRSGPVTAEDLTAIGSIQRRVANVRADVEVLAPPLLVQTDTKDVPTLPTSPPDLQVPLAFETSGDSASAVVALQEFAADNNLKWQRSHRWFHRAEALNGSGALWDAIAVLRHYVQAAREGVGGVVWFDLRDDTSDPRHAQHMQGLVRRDFSPKTPLLGFANTVGMLHGLLYAGEVSGTPAQFESALFIGGNRQVAVLFPKPNRILPAVLAPFQLVPGELTVSGFERRVQPLARSVATPLTSTVPDPVFITLDCQRAQAEPRLGLARPWLRVPRTIFCGQEATLTIEIDAHTDLSRGSYLQLILPSDAPVSSTLSSRFLRAKAGDMLSFDSTLTRTSAGDFAPSTLTVRVSLEGDSVRIPVTLRPLLNVLPVKPGPEITDAQFVIGRLTSPNLDADGQKVEPTQTLHVGYERRALHVAISLPPGASSESILQLGIALENADTHAEARIARLTERPTLTPTWGTARAQLRGWRCRRLEDPPGSTPFCQITIPASALGESSLQAGLRVLLAARYVESEPASWMAPLVREWGSGLDGTRRTTGYRWIRLAEAPETP